MQSEVTTDYAKVLVAQYLESNGYQDSLISFLKDSNLPRRALVQESGESLETILNERIKFAEHSMAESLRTMTLNASLEPLDAKKYGIPSWDYALEFKRLQLHEEPRDLVVDAAFGPSTLLLSTSAKEVRTYDSGLNFSGKLTATKGTGILRPCGALGETGFFYSCGLNGSLNLYSTAGGPPLHSCKIHGRMITHTEICSVDRSWFLVSCGLDNYLKIHLIELQTLHVRPWCEWKLPTACTALQVVNSQDKILVYLARKEHTHVTCYQINTSRPEWHQQYQLALNGAQFTPHAFQVRDMKLLPQQDLLLVATSHTPYMRLLVISIPHHVEGPGPFYDKVLRNMVTEVPLDNYSQPLLGILPGAKGVIVASNVGIYAIDISKGDSWLLEDFPQKRAKCLAVCELTKMVAIGFADKSVYIASANLKM